MSSILTNTSAMIALQTLKGISSGLNKTQDEISTGKSVATARDNAAVWAISKVMEADVQGFKAISSSLALGSSTIAVARSASETITKLLTDMKEKIIDSQGDNVDRAKIQTDLRVLVSEIKSVAAAAQFNGLNLLSNRSLDVGSGTVKVLSSLDRSSNSITASNINVARQDLGTTQAAVSGTALGNLVAASTLNATQSATLTIPPATAITTGYAVSIGILGTVPAASPKFDAATYTTGAGATEQSLILYVAREGDTLADVYKGLEASFYAFASSRGLDQDVLKMTRSATGLTFTSTATDATNTLAVRIDGAAMAAATPVTIGGGLAAIDKYDVTTKGGAAAALQGIEGMLQKSIGSAANFGSTQSRINIQAQFISSLTDSLRSGIGSLVDADMEEASARLQALQVQQQLSIQALSIANQAPQSILSLFR